MTRRAVSIESDDWPLCEARDTHPLCELTVDPARWALGYRTCIVCGSPSPKRTVGPAYNKGPIMLINPKDVKDIGR